MDLVTYCHSILGRWRKHFSQLFNVHGVSDLTQTDIYTAAPLVPESNAFEFEKTNDKLNICQILQKNGNTMKQCISYL